MPGRATSAGMRVQPLVLVIDDSITYRTAIAQALRSAGYVVVAAATGEEGLRAASRLRPDVVVVDRVLPDIDGTEVIRDIRLEPALRRTPCLLITADEDPTVEYAALETGADAYVRKGDDLSVLLARVAALRRDAPEIVDAPASPAARRVMLVAPDGAPHVSQARALPPEEYEVFEVASPSDAVSAIRGGEVACAVIVMTNLAGGVSTLDQIRSAARDAHVPVLVMQDGSVPADASHILARGADDYVSASDDPGLYAARMRALLRRKDMDDEDRRVAQTLRRHEQAASAAEARADVAEQESEFKDRFLAIMSHELRTPLNAILGFTQMLERGVGGPLTAVHHRHVSGIVRSAEHLLTLVNDVLDLAKIRAGKLALRRDVVDLGAVADTARLTASSIASQRGVVLHVDIPADLPPVRGDAVRIQQILYNLLSNGLKFTPPEGAVHLAAAVDGKSVRIDVRDTGIGIPRTDFPRLFRDFERLEHGQSQQADGTGLGLALTRQLVELQGGRIDVESEVGVGSTFSVWLPIASA